LAVVKGQFGGINVDRSPLMLPSGSAISAKNVELRHGFLKKRGGFRLVATATDAINYMTLAGFENGQTFLVVQGDTDIEYAQIDGGQAISLSPLPVLSGGTGGWWFMWADGLYQVTTAGVKKWQGGIDSGTAQGGDATPMIQLASTSSSKDDYYKGRTLITTGGTGSGQTKTIVSYSGSDQKATVDSAWSGTPDNSTTYEIFGIYDAGIGRADDGHNERDGTKSDGTTPIKIPYYPPLWYDDTPLTGDKRGTYNVAISFRNSRTGEEGMIGNISNVIQELPRGFLIYVGSTFSLYPAAGYASGLTAFKTPNDPAKGGTYNFEYDQMVIYQSPGLNDTYQSRTFSMYEVYSGSSDNINTDINLRQNDSLLQRNKPVVNNGGLPPGSDVGVFNGIQAIYANLNTWTEDGLDADEMPGLVMFSLPEFPCMVPRRDRYAFYANASEFDTDAERAELSSTVDPKPWIGQTGTISDEKLVSMQSVQGRTLAFTKRNTWKYGVVGDGRIFASQLHPSIGSDGRYSNTVADGTIHTISSTKWAAFGPDGLHKISDGIFEEILADIPDGYRENIVMGHYSFRDQVWAAIPKANGKVQRILIWDFEAGHITRGGNHTGALCEFEIESLGANEEITALCERVDGHGEPTMLVGTSAGHIYEYPIGYGDGESGSEVDFAAEWEGHFGQERQAEPNTIRRIDAHAGDNVNGVVTATMTPLLTDGEAGADSTTQLLSKDNKLIKINTLASPRKWRMFKFKLSSAKAEGASTDQWQINALNWIVD